MIVLDNCMLNYDNLVAMVFGKRIMNRPQIEEIQNVMFVTGGFRPSSGKRSKFSVISFIHILLKKRKISSF